MSPFRETLDRVNLTVSALGTTVLGVITTRLYLGLMSFRNSGEVKLQIKHFGAADEWLFTGAFWSILCSIVFVIISGRKIHALAQHNLELEKKLSEIQDARKNNCDTPLQNSAPTDKEAEVQAISSSHNSDQIISGIIEIISLTEVSNLRKETLLKAFVGDYVTRQVEFHSVVGYEGSRALMCSEKGGLQYYQRITDQEMKMYMDHRKGQNILISGVIKDIEATGLIELHTMSYESTT
ncbi:hypothetical protein KDL44_07640 [bacterium]|nr:hypothetical protein [bacterium]